MRLTTGANGVIFIAAAAVFGLGLGSLLVAAPGRANDVLDSIRRRLLGDGGFVVSDGLLRAFGVYALLLGSIFAVAVVGSLLQSLLS